MTSPAPLALLTEAVRRGGIVWHEQNNPLWRGKPWTDGVQVDLDEDDVLAAIVRELLPALAALEAQ